MHNRHQSKILLPINLFYFRMCIENVSCCNAFKFTHYFNYAVFGMKSTQNMNLVLITSNLLKINFVFLTNFFCYIYNLCFDCFIQKGFSIFYRENYVVMCLICTVSSFLYVHLRNDRVILSPQQAARNIKFNSAADIWVSTELRSKGVC